MAEQSKEERLQSYVRFIAESEDLPAFGQDIYELMTTVADENAPLQRLTNIILKNISLTTRLVRTVNSVYFNRTGRSILSVSQAVTMLGWDAIRDLASSLIIFEKFDKKSPGVKELMLLSLLTASNARQISLRAGYPRGEEAYLCGMFSGLGELLVACYLPKEYTSILEAMKRNNWDERQACRHVLQFSYEEIGKAIIRHWKLPEKVSGGMEPVEQFSDKVESDEQMLSLMASFSRALSTAVYRLDPREGHERVKALIKKFGSALSVKEDNIEEILKQSVDETRQSFSAAHVPLDNLRLVRHIENALSASREQAAGEIKQEEAKVEAAAPGEESTLARLTKEVESVLESGEEFDLNDIILMILEAVYRGGNFDRALFCLVDLDRSQVQARTGLGADAEALVSKFRFPLSLLSGPVGPALLKKQDVFVDNVGDSRYSKSNFIAVVGACSFGMLPVIVGSEAIGCFYFDRLSAELALDDQQKYLLRTLRDYLGEEIARRRRIA